MDIGGGHCIGTRCHMACHFVPMPTLMSETSRRTHPTPWCHNAPQDASVERYWEETRGLARSWARHLPIHGISQVMEGLSDGHWRGGIDLQLPQMLRQACTLDRRGLGYLP
jgi:hypothetical protein